MGSNHGSCWQRPHKLLKDSHQLIDETKETIGEFHYKDRTIQARLYSYDHDDTEETDENELSAKEKIEREDGILKKSGWRDEAKIKGLKDSKK